MRRLLLPLILTCCVSLCWSQTGPPNSSSRPTQREVVGLDQGQTVKEKGRFKKNWRQPYPNPLRAGIYGLLIPGAGQIYNKRYWKVPLVWGAVGGVIYFADFSAKQYQRFNTAYGLRVASERAGTEPTDEFAGIANNSDTIKARRDLHDKNRQLAIIGIIAVHALQALEAYVDAHLRNFDIEDDLSLRLGPVMNGSSQSGSYIGLGVTATF